MCASLFIHIAIITKAYMPVLYVKTHVYTSPQYANMVSNTLRMSSTPLSAIMTDTASARTLPPSRNDTPTKNPPLSQKFIIYFLSITRRLTSQDPPSLRTARKKRHLTLFHSWQSARQVGYPDDYPSLKRCCYASRDSERARTLICEMIAWLRTRNRFVKTTPITSYS